MEFPFDLEPEGLPEYYQEIYDELIQGSKESQITILPCLDTLQDHIVYVIVRVKLTEDLSEEVELSNEHGFKLSITPLGLVLPPALSDILKPILPTSSSIKYTEEFSFGWDPPTKGTMNFPEDTDE